MIRLSRQDLNNISAQALRDYPREACGLLVGRNEGSDTFVTRICPSDNIAQGPGHDRFEVDPKVRFDLMRELREGADAIVGHYHSHPDHAPEPSATDLDMAFEPEFIWLITQVDKDGAGPTRAWRLNRNAESIEEVELKVDD